MKVGFYEPHIMPDEKLPFIFHRDLIRKKITETHSLAHWHRNVEILFFISGKGEMLCDTQITPVEPGDIFIVNASSMHYVASDDEVRYYCLIVDNSFCAENDLNAESLLFHNHVQDAQASALYEQVIKSYATRHPYYNASVRSAVLALLVYLVCNHTQSADIVRKRAGSKSVDNIKAALGYIHAHFMQKLSVQEVADTINLSQYHFSREFKKVTGVYFVNYINYLRCENAKRLLQSGKYTVAEACTASGFDNASYFSKTFKSFFRKSPAAYLIKE